MRILITGTTGDSMPPPYGGIPKLSLLYGRVWKGWGHEVAITFVYRPKNADDLGANVEYFFEYKNKPSKLIKLGFLIKFFLKNPFLYFRLFSNYFSIYPKLSAEVVLYSAYGVFIDGVVTKFKPDIILGEAALIKTFMAAEIAKRHNIPIVYDTYAEIRDLEMGVNKNMNEMQRRKYWLYFLGMTQLSIGINNCSDGALRYMSKEKVKVFYDTCDFSLARKVLPETKEEMRKHLGLPKDMFLVGAVGAFELRKGHDHLIKAIALAKKAGLNVGAAICGGSGDMKKWQGLAEEEGVKDNVFFFSRISEMDLTFLHRSLDLYSNLSNSNRSCGLDLALLEAMATGLPIIVYDTGNLKTAVQNGENGTVIPMNDIPAVAKAIESIYNFSPEKRKEIGQISTKLAERSDVNNTAKIKLGWFEDVIRNFPKL